MAPSKARSCGYRYRFGNAEGATCSHPRFEGKTYCWYHLPAEQKPRPLPRGFTGLDLREADFRRCELTGAAFTKSDLRGVDFRGTTLKQVDFRGANLIEALWDEADLAGADFFHARYHRPSLEKAHLEGANLTPPAARHLHDLQPGDIFADDFVVEESLGSGSFGLVYKVRRLWSNKFRALKILDPRWYNERNAIQRFLRQRFLMTRVQHPRVVRIIGVHERDGVHYLIMEYHQGRPLSRAIQDGLLRDHDWGEHARLLHGIADGCAALAEAGIYHRDLKPANILLTDPGEPMVLDFELAKYVDLSALSLGLTPGTPRYFSPEHESPLSGFGEYSDVYSFGLVAHEVLTGEFPYDEETGRFLRWDDPRSHCRDPRKLRPELPSALAELVLRCLSYRSAARPQRFADIRQELEVFLNSREEPRPRPEPPPRPQRQGAPPPPPAVTVTARGTERSVVTPGGRVSLGLEPGEVREICHTFHLETFALANEVYRRQEAVPELRVQTYPVTAAEYAKFCRKARRRPPTHFNPDGSPPRGQEDHPVTGVSYHDALAYARWVDADLPSEAEWEYVAKGTSRRWWPWGSAPPTAAPTANFMSRGTVPVASYREGASPFGVLDLAGNVWEWTSTTYDELQTYKMVKGGSWTDTLPELRCSARFPLPPDGKYPFVGFRLVRR